MKFTVNPKFIATGADIGEFTLSTVNGGYVLKSARFKQILKKSEYDAVMAMFPNKYSHISEDAVIIDTSALNGDPEGDIQEAVTKVEAVAPKPARTRRTKAQIEADKAAQGPDDKPEPNVDDDGMEI